MLGRAEVGTVYRAGAGGIRVVYRDGRVVQHPAFTLVVFERYPLKIEGRLFRAGGRGRLQYEAPALNNYQVKG